MPRIMSIDFGTKRMGIAVTDPMKIIATGLTTIHPKDAVTFLKDYFSKEVVECLVIGEPKQMDNSASEVEKDIKHFINLIKKNFPNLKIDRYDERFTSKMAFNAMLEGGLKKKDRANKETVDMVSATIILQSYMEFLK